MRPGPERPRVPYLRVGRKVGRTLYIQRGYEPSDDDELIGMVDSPEIALVLVSAVNGDSDLRDLLSSALTQRATSTEVPDV